MTVLPPTITVPPRSMCLKHGGGGRGLGRKFSFWMAPPCFIPIETPNAGPRQVLSFWMAPPCLIPIETPTAGGRFGALSSWIPGTSWQAVVAKTLVRTHITSPSPPRWSTHRPASFQRLWLRWLCVHRVDTPAPASHTQPLSHPHQEGRHFAVLLFCTHRLPSHPAKRAGTSLCSCFVHIARPVPVKRAGTSLCSCFVHIASPLHPRRPWLRRLCVHRVDTPAPAPHKQPLSLSRS